MNDYNYDNWEYGTGRTQPPKSHGGIIALLLILVIFLTGIVTVLGILNIRLSQQLSQAPPRQDLELSFHQEQQTEPSAGERRESVQSQEPRAEFDLTLGQTPQAQENIPQDQGLSLQEIYRRNIPSVVSIRSETPQGGVTGTGVILSDDGYIVTNAHVVEGGHTLTVILADGQQAPAQLVGQDPVTDLAVLHIQAQGLTPAQFGDSGLLQVGDSVAAIGDPLGIELRGTMTDGIISAINRDVVLDGRTLSLIQTDAALNPGNSGGPLINCYGQVIGINTLKIGDRFSAGSVEGLGFAIPSATVKEIVDQLIDQGYVSGRPTLGITGESLSPSFRSYYRLPAGLYITGIDPDSPAESSGLQPGDIIMELDGVAVDSMDTLNAILYAHQVGDSVTVTVYRAGQQAKGTLILTEDKP